MSVKERYRAVSSENLTNNLQKRGNYDGMLVLLTYTDYRFVPQLVTLNDLLNGVMAVTFRYCAECLCL